MHRAGLKGALGDVGWIGHSGLAGSRPGAGPSGETLDAAARLELDWLELDVCATLGGVLVLRHHSRLPGGRPVHGLSVADLRRLEPDVLTLTEAAEQLEGRVPLLIDVKSPRVVGPLADWLASHRGSGVFAVCSESRDALEYLRERLPWVPRWRSLTVLGRFTAESVPPLLRPLLRDMFPGAVWTAADDLAGLGSELASAWIALLGSDQVGERMRRAMAATQRDDLPRHLAGLGSEVAAAAISVDHWAITPGLCEAAHALGLTVAAWTVNRIELARDLVGCGVDFITSDDVATVRAAVAALSRRRTGVGDDGVAVRCRPAGGTGA